MDTSFLSTVVRPAGSPICRAASTRSSGRPMHAPSSSRVALLDAATRRTASRGERAKPPARPDAATPTTDTSTACRTCSTGPGSPTTRSATCGSWTGRRGRPRRLTAGPTRTASPPGRRMAGVAFASNAAGTTTSLPVRTSSSWTSTGAVDPCHPRAAFVFGARPGSPTATHRGARPPLAAARRQPQRHLAVRRGRLRCHSGRRPQPLGAPRPDARRRDGQRRDPGEAAR